MGHQPLIKSNHLYKEIFFQTTIFRAICWTADRHNSTKLWGGHWLVFQHPNINWTAYHWLCTAHSVLLYQLYRVSSQHIELFGVNTTNVYLHSMCYDAMDWQCTVGWQCCSRVLLNQQCWYRSLLVCSLLQSLGAVQCQCMAQFNDDGAVQCQCMVQFNDNGAVYCAVRLHTGAERCNSN